MQRRKKLPLKKIINPSSSGQLNPDGENKLPALSWLFMGFPWTPFYMHTLLNLPNVAVVWRRSHNQLKPRVMKVTVTAGTSLLRNYRVWERKHCQGGSITPRVIKRPDTWKQLCAWSRLSIMLCSLSLLQRPLFLHSR